MIVKGIIYGLFILLLFAQNAESKGVAGWPQAISYFGDDILLTDVIGFNVPFDHSPSVENIDSFYAQLNAAQYQPLINTLLNYKNEKGLNDWLYYQLIRSTAEAIAPKADNYSRYTLYKWFLLGKSGYNARLALCKGQLVFYVQSDENVYDIPYYINEGKQYICLNNHDYTTLNFQKDEMMPVPVRIPEGVHAFSYKVTQMPDFTPENYTEKELQFSYNNTLYHFKVKLNKELPAIFKNYPVVDYASYFNIPLSNETYNSFIPILKENVSGMKQKNGVDYLMRFTRNAFLYEADQVNYGKEKRLAPEQTLLTEYSDCDDRAALFFYLVKEIYNLPMIVLAYPTHVTIAIKLDKPQGTTIDYKGAKYSVCEPTPQAEDLKVGEIASELRHMNYTVAYEYHP